MLECIISRVIEIENVHWSSASSNGSGGVVLGREDVAAGPGNLGAQRCQGFNEDSGLDG